MDPITALTRYGYRAGGGRCESRNADGAVNPYLALALAAGLERIRDKDRPARAERRQFVCHQRTGARQARCIDFLPQNLLEAVEAFDSDLFVEATFGKALKDEFIKYKLQEWNHYHLHVSQSEIERYSTIF